MNNENTKNWTWHRTVSSKRNHENNRPFLEIWFVGMKEFYCINVFMINYRGKWLISTFVKFSRIRTNCNRATTRRTRPTISLVRASKSPNLLLCSNVWFDWSKYWKRKFIHITYNEFLIESIYQFKSVNIIRRIKKKKRLWITNLYFIFINSFLIFSKTDSSKSHRPNLFFTLQNFLLSLINNPSLFHRNGITKYSGGNDGHFSILLDYWESEEDRGCESSVGNAHQRRNPAQFHRW